MTELRACPECGAEVPTGRLSCGACGALLASVHGREAAEAPAGSSGPLHASAAAVARPAAVGEAPSPGVAPSLGETQARGETPAHGEGPELEAPELEPADVPAAADTVQPSPAPERVATPTPALEGVAAPPMLPPIEPPPPPMPPIPGGYLPPSAVMRGAPVPQPTITQAAVASPPAAGPPGWSPPAPVAEPGEPTPGARTRVPVLELPFVLAPGAGPRLVAAGAVVAVIAFVLPWVPGGGVVIGGAFGNGYFATWGLAAIGNLLPFLLAWVTLILAVLPNRVSRAVSLGLLPVFLGGLFAGFGWVYLIAPYGIGLGIWALVGSAVLLVAGGSLVLREGSPDA